ncbi:uncharacterized protein LOC111375673 [Olea europaea var. sylvestris]|uniref:uncharacterized protein LOC111375673 n=1 Tax=Olea europaea var. sylvestris TaxID=158386 RepID=UPI000C1CEA31|nr:uncharacterized protein LOC111375673 [Olea europaea var. sylvestris]
MNTYYSLATSKNYSKEGHKTNCRKGLLLEKASSFQGRSGGAVVEGMLPRPRKVPDLVAGKRVRAWLSDVVVVKERPKLTKLLLNVIMHRSVGAIQVVMPPEATMEGLIAVALRQYAKEGRRTTTKMTFCNM